MHFTLDHTPSRLLPRSGDDRDEPLLCHVFGATNVLYSSGSGDGGGCRLPDDAKLQLRVLAYNVAHVPFVLFVSSLWTATVSLSNGKNSRRHYHPIWTVAVAGGFQYSVFIEHNNEWFNAFCVLMINDIYLFGFRFLCVNGGQQRSCTSVEPLCWMRTGP
jgi:hypothetical protein